MNFMKRILLATVFVLALMVTAVTTMLAQSNVPQTKMQDKTTKDAVDKTPKEARKEAKADKKETKMEMHDAAGHERKAAKKKERAVKKEDKADMKDAKDK
jgi:hypothetical protein